MAKEKTNRITPSLAKLTPPRLAKVCSRIRLFKQLDEARDKPVIWISAPAGSGKTILVASYLKERKIKPLWYQVDGGDADIASFFYYLGLLGKQAAPKKKKDLPLLTPEYLLGLPTFTRNFFRELFSCMKVPGVLVLDNFQDAGEDIPLHEILPTGLQETPKGISVVIISRSEPVASVARLRASENLAVFDWDQLRLTDDESVEVGKLRSGAKNLDDAVYHSLNSQTDGWVTGLVLQLEHTSNITVPDSIKNQPNQKLVFDYFAGEIFNTLDKESQDFLLRVAFLPKITIAAAKQLTHSSNTEKILSNLTERNYFTIRREGRTPAYEFHPLFREFLQARSQKELTLDQFRELLVKSANVLTDEGNIEHAIELLLHSQNWEGTAQLILQHAQRFVEQGRGATVVHWLQTFPEGILQSQPWLSYWLGISQLGYNPAGARKSLEGAYFSFQSAGDNNGQLLTWCAIVDTFVYEWSDFTPLDKWLDAILLSTVIRKDYPSNDTEARFSCAMFMALVHRKPDHPELSLWEEIVHKYVMGGDNFQLRISIGPHLLYYFTWILGDQKKAKSVYDALRPLMSGPAVPPLVYTTWKFISAAYSWMIAENDRTIRYADEGLEMAENSGVHVWDMFTRMLAVFGYLSSDRVEEAQPYLHKSNSKLVPNRYSDSTGYYHVAGWAALAQNNLGEAADYARLALEFAKKSGNKWFNPIMEDQVARTTLYDGKYDKALKIVRKARTNGREIRSNSVEYLTWLTEYEIRLAQGDKAGSISSLKRFLEVGRAHDIRNHTHWQSQLMRELYARALELNIETEYICSIIKQRGLLPPPDQPTPDTWPYPLKLYTLGRFSILKNDLVIKFKGKAQKRPLGLLKALVAFGGRKVSEEKLSEALWPDTDGDTAHRSFTTTLHRLRGLIGSDVIILQQGCLSLDPRYVWVDTWLFERLLGQIDNAIEQQTMASEQIQQAIHKARALYQGHFLEQDSEDAWVLSLRERLRSRWLRTIKNSIHYLGHRGHCKLAIDLYQQALELDGLAEELYRGLMGCYAAQGQYAEALSVYGRCQNILSTVLDITPGEATERLHHALQTRDKAVLSHICDHCR